MASTPLPSSSPQRLVAGSLQYYYGFSIRYSNEDNEHFFLQQFKRGHLQVSCTLKATSHSGFLSLTTKVHNSFTPATAAPEISRLQAVLDTNTKYLSEYLGHALSGFSSKEIAMKAAIEKQNAEFQEQIRQLRVASYQTEHFLDPNVKKQAKIPIVFEGFCINLFLSSAGSGWNFTRIVP